MSLLGRISISAKIIGLVLIMSAITLGVGATGYVALQKLQSEVQQAATVSGRAFDAVVANRGSRPSPAPSS